MCEAGAVVSRNGDVARLQCAGHLVAAAVNRHYLHLVGACLESKCISTEIAGILSYELIVELRVGSAGRLDINIVVGCSAHSCPFNGG